MAFDNLKVREALARRAAEIAGRETKQAGRPIGWNPAYQYDHWQSGRDALEAEQVAQRTAQAQQMDDWKSSRDDWRASVYPAQFDQSGQLAAQVLGMGGEELPPDALGWDWNGRAYYGEGFQGWLKGLRSRWSAPFGDTAKPTIAMDEMPETPPTGYERAQGGVSGRKPNVGKTFENVKAGTAGKFLGYMSRGISELISGVLTVYGEAAKKTEQAAETRASQEQAAADSPLPSVQDMPQWLENLIEATPVAFNAYQDVRLWASPEFRKTLTAERRPGAIPFIEQGSELDVAWQSGRIAYSAVIDPALREEYRRRYRAGENPQLLSMELENPVAEMVGQLVYDPLFLVGGSTRAARDTRRITSARGLYLDVPESVAKAINALGDVRGDARAVEGFQDLVTSVVAANRATAGDLDDYAKAYGLSSLTATGKRYVIGEHVGELTHWIAAQTKNDPDQTIDVLRALMDMASGDADRVANGIAATRHFTAPQPLFSRVGRETGTVLNRMVGDDPKGFLKGLAKAQEGGLDEVIDFIDKRTGTAIEGMFPTLTERIAAKERLPFGTRSIVRLDNMLQKAAYRRLNTFFAGVYMGLSPGYLIRNVISNIEHILVDEGPRALLRSPSEWNKNTKGWLGGVVPKGVSGFSAGTAGVDVSRRLYFTRMADKAEAAASAQVVGSAVERTMRRMLRRGRALPDPGELLTSGLTETHVRHFEQLVIRNRGDVDAAFEVFKRELADGDIDVFRSFDWIDEKDVDAMVGFGFYDNFTRDAGGATTQDEAAAALDAIHDNMRAEAAKVVDDVPAVDDAAAGVADVRALGEARAAGDVDDGLVRNATYYTQANDLAHNAYFSALTELRRLTPDNPAWAQIGDKLDLPVAKAGVVRLHEQRRNTAVALKEASHRSGFDMVKAWKDLGQSGPLPKDVYAFRQWLWGEYYFPYVRGNWEKFRDQYAELIEAVFKDSGQETGLLLEARKRLDDARKFDDFLRQDQVRRQLAAAADAGDQAGVVRILANKYRIATKATDTGTGGANLDQRLLNIINANLDEGATPFAGLADIPEDVAERALLKHSLGEGGTAAAAAAPPPPAPQAAAAAAQSPSADGWVYSTSSPFPAAAAPPPPPYAGNVPSAARVIQEQMPGLDELFKRLKQGITENWGRRELAFSNRQIEGALSKYTKQAKRQVAEARLLAAGVADAARKFTLLSYPEKTGFDLALAYIFPYQFWYNRSYQNWMRRLVYNPEVIAGYAKYKDALAKLHAGAPEWWKYQVNTNELFGIDSENPLYFNLEATLNPLNGLTGIDFNDPNRRPEGKLEWWTNTVDAIGRFGPSIWTPISIGTAVALHMSGEEDAAARWAGRLVPQTATLKSIMTLANVRLKTGRGLNELDPLVYFMSNGLDPYEQRRVGRALYALGEEGVADGAALQDAAVRQDGDLWYQGVERAISDRAWGQISSFFLGVGFKARNQSDIAIDQFYTDYSKLWAMRPLLSPVEFRNSMDTLRSKYPFMDTLLLSKKSGADRDAAYAYSVIGRIPPGQSDDLYELAGVDKRLVSKFYETKGELEKWPEADRAQFMAGTVQLGALLALPDDATRAEWSRAWGMKKEIEAETERMYGADIRDRISAYYSFGEDMDAKRDYLDRNPAVRDAMDRESSLIANTPFLAAYYGGISKIESYYEGLMYASIRKQLGDDIWQKWDAWYEFKNAGDEKGAKAYWKAHPELGRYMDMKERELAIIAKQLVAMEKLLPDARPARLRPGADLSSFAAQDVASGLQPQETIYDYTWQDWQALIPQPLGNLLTDKVYGGKKLTKAGEKMIERMADEMGISEALLLELLESSISEAR